MSKGCLISDLDALRTDYSYKMSIFFKKVRENKLIKERDYRRYKVLYETYKNAYHQIDNLLKDISRGNVHLITFNGKSQSLTDWSNELNINFNTLYQRIIISKWSIEKAFMSPIRSHQAIKETEWVYD